MKLEQESAYAAFSSHLMHVLAERSPLSFATIAAPASRMTERSGFSDTEVWSVIVGVAAHHSFDMQQFTEAFMDAWDAEDASRKPPRSLNAGLN